ncbi:MAG: AMP-binding protein [Desulfobacterales bacterium]|nr:AMP-binding protein [Desulfobacterales bacterium]
MVCQGYGLTETSPMITCNSPDGVPVRHRRAGRSRACEVKIADDGEILARGRQRHEAATTASPRRRRRPSRTAGSRPATSGVIDADGFLRITDRKKDLIITAQGKNIAPQHIETLIGQDHYIEQIAAIGDKRKYISALIVPSFPVRWSSMPESTASVFPPVRNW